MLHCFSCLFHFFFFNDTAPPEIYTLSLHDALPISRINRVRLRLHGAQPWRLGRSRFQRRDGGSRLPDCAGHRRSPALGRRRSEEHTSELQSHSDLVCRLLLEKKKKKTKTDKKIR